MKGGGGSSSPRFQILLLLGASGRDVPHSNLPLWAESVFVKPRHGVVSGPVVDRQNVKPARAIANMAFREKPLRRSNEHVLLVSGNAQFGQSGVLFALGPRSDFDKCQPRAVIIHQVNLALGPASHVISCLQDVFMPPPV